MPSNVEIKARIPDYDQFRSLAENVSGQKGTYYRNIHYVHTFTLTGPDCGLDSDHAVRDFILLYDDNFMC